MTEGKITTIKDGYFFIDKDCYCKSSNYEKEPVIGDIVQYEKITHNDGRKSATNVKFIRNSFGATVGSSNDKNNYLDDFLKDLDEGYFENNNLKKKFIIDYPQKLAQFFAQQGTINNTTQIRRFYDTVMKIYGRSKYSKNFDTIIPELYGIIPQLEKAKNRNLISQEFYNYLKSSITEAVKTIENFEKGFVKNFEYLICYYIKK